MLIMSQVAAEGEREEDEGKGSRYWKVKDRSLLEMLCASGDGVSRRTYAKTGHLMLVGRVLALYARFFTYLGCKIRGFAASWRLAMEFCISILAVFCFAVL